MSNEQQASLEIWAGHCSANPCRLDEIYKIADIRVKDRNGQFVRAVKGTRMVGVKSRSEKQVEPTLGGMDLPILEKNRRILATGGSIWDLLVPPTVEIGSEVVRTTGMMIVAEVVDPWLQMPAYEIKKIPSGYALFWNPAVQQLGFPLEDMSVFTSRNGWDIGIKNGKWLGDTLEQANRRGFKRRTSMESAWEGLGTYVQKGCGRTFLIERGVDVPGKGRMRNAAIAEISGRVKDRTKLLLALDPSHEFGPNYSEQEIIEGTIKALRRRIGGKFLYDALLIEIGQSTTDSKQHISIDGLGYLAGEVSRFRDLTPPFPVPKR